MSTEGKQVEGVVLEIKVFEKFVMMYQDRYGKQKMGKETQAMFYEKLCSIDTDHFFAVTATLLGAQKFAFPWMTVLEKVSIVYPETTYQLKLEKEWKLEYDHLPGINKRLQHSKIMSCIPDMVKNNPKGWRIDYFKLIYDLLGHTECMEIALKLQFQFPQFKQYLYSRGQKI